MIPTASHNILRLTDNVMISPAEISVWKKIMRKTVNFKIAMTRRQMTLNMLRMNGMGLSPLLLFSAGGSYQLSTSSKNQASNTNKQILESGGKHSQNC